MRNGLFRLTGLLLASTCGWACSDSSATPQDTDNNLTGWHAGWKAYQAEHLKAEQAYVDGNAEQRAAFDSTAVGFTGFPYVIFQLLGELGFDAELTGLWGRIGLLPDGLAPESVPKTDPKLPLGLGYSTVKNPRTGLRSSNLSCGTCHIGKVDLGDGHFRYLYGAPNTQINVTDYLGTINAVADAFGADPEGYGQKIADLIKTKQASDFYPETVGDFDEEKQILSDPAGVATLLGLIVRSIKFNTQLRETTVNREGGAYKAHGLDFDAVTRGNSDAFGLTTMLFMSSDYAQLVFDPEKALAWPGTDAGISAAIQGYLQARSTAPALPVNYMPENSSATDIMSVWRQADQKVTHWSGDMKAGIFASAAGSYAVTGGSIAAMDHPAVARSYAFIEALPAPVYPFDVDVARATRGEALFQKACASCHEADKVDVMDAGTDMSRSNAFNDFTLLRFDADLSVSSCFSDPACKLDTTALADFAGRYTCSGETCEMQTPVTTRNALVDNRGKGYKSTILDGIWARAPYLHNGSVPTLYHLLRPAKRPGKFCQGRADYDQAMVGFGWDLKGDGCPANSLVYTVVNAADAARVGYIKSNLGHTYGEDLTDDEVEDLLAFLKTL